MCLRQDSSPYQSGLLCLSRSVGDFRALVFELCLCKGGLGLGDPLFCKLLGFVPSLRTLIGLDFVEGFPHGDPEADSLLPQADSVCHLAFQENEAFHKGGLHSSECYLSS